MALFKRGKSESVSANPLTRSPTVAPVPVPAPEKTNRANPSRKEKAVALKTEEITTILGRGSEFEGKLQFEGTLQIEGEFSGQIISDSVLVVGEGAKVRAEIDIGTIIINGEVHGNIRARQGVEIRQPGKVVGNLETPSLVIEKGVTFDGSCVMAEAGKAKKAPVFEGNKEIKDNKDNKDLKDKPDPK